VAVIVHNVIHSILANERVDHGDIQSAIWLSPPSTDLANFTWRDTKEDRKLGNPLIEIPLSNQRRNGGSNPPC
jgi:hypothetical protein